MTLLFNILKSLKTIVQEEIKPNRAHYYIFTGALAAAYGRQFVAQLLKTVMWLDGIGFLGHLIEDDRNWNSGRMMPPTFWENMNMPDHAYRYYLRTAHKGVRLLHAEPLNGTAFYITVTMAAKRYIPDENYAYKAEMLPSKEKLEVPIMDYCNNTKYEFGFHESEPVAPYYVSEREGRFISFDDSRSLAIKLCRGRKKLLGIEYGLIVYSTEMDDPTNQCGKGGLPTSQLLKKIDGLLQKQLHFA
ncbi:hypothetical protein MTO96_009526 [Rhipicephalus appendiculatus]